MWRRGGRRGKKWSEAKRAVDCCTDARITLIIVGACRGRAAARQVFCIVVHTTGVVHGLSQSEDGYPRGVQSPRAPVCRVAAVHSARCDLVRLVPVLSQSCILHYLTCTLSVHTMFCYFPRRLYRCTILVLPCNLDFIKPSETLRALPYVNMFYVSHPRNSLATHL